MKADGMPESHHAPLHHAPPHVREAAFAPARQIQAQAQTEHRLGSPHRSIQRLIPGPRLLLQMTLLPLALSGLALAAQTWLYAFWQAYLLAWAGWLHLPLKLRTGADPASDRPLGHGLGLVWTPGDASWALSLSSGVWLGAALCLLAWLVSGRWPGKALPIKYLVRVVVVVQAVAVAYFWWAPDALPHSVLDHLGDVLDTGDVLIVAIPVLLGLGYFALNISLWVKLRSAVLLMGYFVLMVPHQALVHLVVLQHLSVAFMPVLYICFGALFDMMVFVALYAWIVSLAPPLAPTRGAA